MKTFVYITMPSSTNGCGVYNLINDGNIKQALARIQAKIDDYDKAYLIIPSENYLFYQFESYVYALFGDKVEIVTMMYPKNIAETRRYILNHGSKRINQILEQFCPELELVETEMILSSYCIPETVKQVNVYLNNSPRDDIDQPVNEQAAVIKLLLNDLYRVKADVKLFANNQGQIDSIFATGLALDINLAPVLYSNKVVKQFKVFSNCRAMDIKHVLYPYRLNDPTYDLNGFLSLADQGYRLLCTNPTNLSRSKYGCGKVAQVSTSFNLINVPFYVFTPTDPDVVFHHSVVELIEAGCEYINSKGQIVDFFGCEALTRFV